MAFDFHSGSIENIKENVARLRGESHEPAVVNAELAKLSVDFQNQREAAVRLLETERTLAGEATHRGGYIGGFAQHSNPKVQKFMSMFAAETAPVAAKKIESTPSVRI